MRAISISSASRLVSFGMGCEHEYEKRTDVGESGSTMTSITALTRPSLKSLPALLGFLAPTLFFLPADLLEFVLFLFLFLAEFVILLFHTGLAVGHFPITSAREQTLLDARVVLVVVVVAEEKLIVVFLNGVAFVVEAGLC